MNNKPKILIFDSMHPIPVSQQLFQAMKNIGIDTYYLNGKELKVKLFYKFRRAIAKFLFRKKNPEHNYYYHSKRSPTYKNIIKKIRPDIILVIGFFYSYLDKKILLKLQDELNFKLILLDSDSGNMLPNYKKVIFFLKHELSTYDQIFSFSKRIANYWQNLGYQNVSFFPYGASEIPHQPTTKKVIDICFIGNPEMRRLMTLETLHQHNIKIFGKKWQQFKPLLNKELVSKITFQNIWGDELYALVNQSKIILNINIAPWHAIESGVNLRVFEVLALKGFLLTDYCEELNDLFKLGREIETYKSIEELHDKINYYLTHEAEREKIAQNGHRKFLESYTWEKRAKKLLKVINQEDSVPNLW